MSRSLKLYTAVEGVIGRRSAWRLGRWLYTGARRELQNDPRINGEYALLEWVIVACQQAGDNGAVFFDVGANVGNWSAVLVQRLAVTPALRARIYAFEPAPAQRSRLIERVAKFAEGAEIVCRPEALSAERGDGLLQVTGDNSGTNALQPSASGVRDGLMVSVETIDSVMSRDGIKHLTLLKIDTEGNDLNVIRGARNAMANGTVDVIQFEYNWRWIAFGNTMRSIFDTIEGLDLTLGRLTNEGIEIYRQWHPELDRFIETNFVLLAPRLKRYLPAREFSFDVSNVACRVGHAK